MLGTTEVPPLPVPAGTSYFHIKGSFYAGILARVDREIPGGMARLLDELPEPSLRTFFSRGLFLASAWYDALPVVPLAATLARLDGRTFEAQVRFGMRRRAVEDIRGVYRALFKLATPQLVAPRLVRGVSKYLSFGHAENMEVHSGWLTATSQGIPGYMLSAYITSADEFSKVALELSGAKEVRIVRTLQGVRGGPLDPISMRIHMSWNEAGAAQIAEPTPIPPSALTSLRARVPCAAPPPRFTPSAR
ncbi:hypothetical protein [Chondromyces apiculatus]|uniref:Uncharacterized protein n=1 Tax=Chondromyces apiculatus DSM 436 TaxID=1192034 RepID=A0A017STE8_9BACT|nr:hypothetical protein [Chondromyces apiculatus]EYF00249.1 Hypothetical protein CAP_1034 [Chondromyces apiculatus DSM 436]